MSIGELVCGRGTHDAIASLASMDLTWGQFVIACPAAEKLRMSETYTNEGSVA